MILALLTCFKQIIRQNKLHLPFNFFGKFSLLCELVFGFLFNIGFCKPGCKPLYVCGIYATDYDFHHLADVLLRASLLYGDQTLLTDYNERVAEKMNAKSSETDVGCAKTVGVVRGMQQMMADVENYDPSSSYLGMNFSVGGLFNAKKQFYRLISLLVSDLGMIFDIRSPSPWQVISELQARGITSVSESDSMKVCLSIANEIRLKTYFANKGQKELFSPVREYENTAEQSIEAAPTFRDFDEDVLVRLLSTSNDMFTRCHKFCLKWIQQGKIDESVFRNPSPAYSRRVSLGFLYFRLQNLHKALEWMKSVPIDSPDYGKSKEGQGHIYFQLSDYAKSVECFEEALQCYYQSDELSATDLLSCIGSLGFTLLRIGKYKVAIIRLEEAISKHCDVFGEGSQTVLLATLMQKLGYTHYELGDMGLAVKILKAVQEMQNGFSKIPDEQDINLNVFIALSLSKVDQHDEALKYIERGLELSHKIYGANNLNLNLARVYNLAGLVYARKSSCKAVSFFKRCLEIHQLLFGDNPHRGKNLDCTLD